MDGERFDSLTRGLSSRRTILASGFAVVAAWLGGGQATEAKPKACGKTQKRCGKRCIPRRSCCLRTHKKCGARCVPKSVCCPGTRRCGNGCIPVSQCCPQCPPLYRCANGVCVIGQGTCPLGADVCGNGPAASCNTLTATCDCYQTTAGETRCGDGLILPPENGCINDLHCAARYPNIPGVFCTRGRDGAGGIDPCGGVANFCQAPCPG